MPDTPDWTRTVGRYNRAGSVSSAGGVMHSITFPIDTDTRSIIVLTGNGSPEARYVKVIGVPVAGLDVPYYDGSLTPQDDLPVIAYVNYDATPTIRVEFTSLPPATVIVLRDSLVQTVAIASPSLVTVRGEELAGSSSAWPVGIQGTAGGVPVPVSITTDPVPARTQPRPPDDQRTSLPNAGVQATLTFPATPGKRWLLRYMDATLTTQAGAAAGNVGLFVRDGAAGVGAILWAIKLSTTGVNGANDHQDCHPPIVGTAGNAMTVEFQALVANCVEWLSAGADKI